MPGTAEESPRSSYHHGDLAAALIEAAYELVREQDADAVSLREACRAVGVTPAAAYHHFPDRAALLRAVARRALADLAATIQAALARVPATDPRRRLVTLSRAYVGWALDEPRVFRLALGPGRDYPGEYANPEPFALLTAELDAFTAAGHVRPDRRPHAELVVWAATHGTACLLADGPLQPAGGRRGALRLTTTITDTVLDGLAR